MDRSRRREQGKKKLSDYFYDRIEANFSDELVVLRNAGYQLERLTPDNRLRIAVWLRVRGIALGPGPSLPSRKLDR